MVNYRAEEMFIGELALGGGQPVRLQSMTNTSTADVNATVAQAIRLFEAGAELVRFSVPDRQSAESLLPIKNKLRAAGFNHPLVADIHFRPELAILAARHVDKIRINPANFSGTVPAGNALKTLVKVCHDHGTAIRTGTNLGSLAPAFLKTFPSPTKAITEVTLAFLGMLEALGFFRSIVSLKASHVPTMIQAYLNITNHMQKTGRRYPIHLGVTEAGNGLAGRIRSAAGSGTLLRMGIGDTIRVSLTEDPVNEITAAKKILHYAKNTRAMEYPATKYVPDASSPEDLAIMTAIDTGSRIIRSIGSDGIMPSPDTSALPEIQMPEYESIGNKGNTEMIRELILQAFGYPSRLTAFIACPACGRTTVDLEGLLSLVKESVGNIPGLKIAIMGCVVNGPGEMADAHYGLMASTSGRIWLFKGDKVIKKGLSPNHAPEVLKNLIQDDGWLQT